MCRPSRLRRLSIDPNSSSVTMSKQTFSWNTFVSELDALDWEKDTAEHDGAVRELLGNVYENKSIVTDRTREILASEDEYEKLKPYHSYPRILMDKLVLYVDPEDRYRIRLHRFNSLRHTAGAKEKTHSHKWPAFSLILKGSYTEEMFKVNELRIDDGYADIDLEERASRVAGDVDYKPAGRPHNVANESPEEPCFSLFIRGPSLMPYGVMFDVEDKACRPWHAAEDSMRIGLRDLGEFRADYY